MAKGLFPPTFFSLPCFVIKGLSCFSIFFSTLKILIREIKKQSTPQNPFTRNYLKS